MVSKRQGIKQEKRIRQIKICTRCGSTDITWDYGNAWIIRFGINRDSCNECGFKGNFPTIDKDKVAEFRRMLKNKHSKKSSIRK
jgi:hypothetical protein